MFNFQQRRMMKMDLVKLKTMNHSTKISQKKQILGAMILKTLTSLTKEPSTGNSKTQSFRNKMSMNLTKQNMLVTTLISKETEY